ncbi:MAG: helix-turn-helix domain-containing protein [Stackebrandtia sp.]
MAKRPMGPTVSQRILGAELRKLREAKEMSLEVVADALGYSETKISRIETARNLVHKNDVTLLLNLYEVDDQEQRDDLLDLSKPRRREKGWWNAYSDVVPNKRWALVRLENEAERLRSYQAAFIPGLLQTEEYTAALVEMSSPTLAAESRQRVVEMHRARQQILTREFPVELWAVIDETALRRLAAMPDKIARAQFARLLEAAELPTVTIQVLPLSIGLHTGMNGAFTLIGFPDPAGQIVFLDSRTGGMFLEESRHVASFDQDFAHLQAESLGKCDSLELIRFIASDNDLSRTD